MSKHATVSTVTGEVLGHTVTGVSIGLTANAVSINPFASGSVAADFTQDTDTGSTGINIVSNSATNLLFKANVQLQTPTSSNLTDLTNNSATAGDVAEALAQGWTLWHSFSGTNGLGTNMVSPPDIGHFVRLAGPAGDWTPNSESLERTNGAITMRSTNATTQETFYYAMASASTNALTTIEAQLDSASSTNWWQSIGLHISETGSISSGRLAHIGVYPAGGQVRIDFHTNGYSGQTVNGGSISFDGFGNFNSRSNNVVRIVVDGSFVWASVNGIVRWTNNLALAGQTWGSNIVVQLSEPLPNSDGRLFLHSVKASATPMPGEGNRLSISNARFTGDHFAFDWFGQTGHIYSVEQATFPGAAWTTLTNLTGGNTTSTFITPLGDDARVFRIRVDLAPPPTP